MELQPYKALVRSFIVQELKGSGWFDLICVPIENPETATPEAIQNGLESLHRLLYRAEKVELSVQGVQLCIRNLDQGARTFRIIASTTHVAEPQILG
jgi:hypothetical protein